MKNKKFKRSILKDFASTIIGLFFAVVIIVMVGSLFSAAKADTIIEADDVLECAKPTYDGCMVGDIFPQEVEWVDYVKRETGRIDLEIAGLLYDIERDVVLVYLVEARHVVL